MQDKSSYSSPNKPQISEGLQNFINAMVEEIILEGKSYDKKRKYLKTYSQNEEIDFEELEKNFNDFFELLQVMKESDSNVLKKYYYQAAEKCYVLKSTAESFLLKKQENLKNEMVGKMKSLYIGSNGGLVGAHLLDMQP
jgi:hypothetical protein